MDIQSEKLFSKYKKLLIILAVQAYNYIVKSYCIS